MSRYRILVVEDEAIVSMDIEARLAAMGYQLAGTASSGGQAVMLADTTRPDLVLMDIRLQGEMDGIEAAQKIHRQFHIPVIFLTAYSEESTLERAKLAEPFGYILKPFDDRELKSAIEIAIYKHRTEEELLRRNRLYAVLSHVNEAIIHIQTREELLQSVCRVVVGYGGMELVWIGWLEQGESRIRPVAWFGHDDQLLRQADFHVDTRLEEPGNPGRAIREGKPFVCNDCGGGNCLYPPDKAPSRFGFQSCASFPLWFGGEARGVLSCCVTESAFFRLPEVDLLEEVAADISFALDKIEGERQRKEAEREKEITVEALALINSATDTAGLLGALLSRLKKWSGCEAAGIRLRQGDDYPYFETSGFPEHFVRLENSLCSRDAEGKIVLDAMGNPVLECMCGNILQGRVDPGKPFFTNGGSFWSNRTTELLATTTEADRQARTRNRCNGAGYESVALIPLRSRDQTFGLIQLNDTRPGRFTPGKIALFERLGDNIANFLARMQLEDLLKESESRLRTIGDNLPDGFVYQYTRDSAGKPGFLHISAGVQRICGVSPDEALANADVVLGRIDPDQAQAYQDAELESAAALSDFAMDLRLRLSDGSWGWLHARSRPHRRPDGQVVWDGVGIDISAHRQTEAQLRKLSAVVEQTTAAVVITDLAGNIEYVNPAFIRTTGYAEVEALGKTPRILQSGETPPEVYGELWQTITAGQEWRGNLRNRRKDGTLFWERVVISPLRDATGRMTHFIAVKEDITTQKTLEDQLHQAQKMEFVGRLAGGVAHDFNNMLMVISGYTDIALSQIKDDDPLHPLLMEVHNAAKRSANLTRQLLAFARKQAISPVLLDINEVLEGMLKMLRRLIGEDINLVWLPGKGLWKVKMDPSQVDQLLANLAVNARDAIAGVGALTIETVNSTLTSEEIEGEFGCAPGEYVTIVVRDSGVGMSNEVMEQIFEPFFTTKVEGKGTGLGLATVYGIMRQNNGCITVESEVGRGSSFYLHIPRVGEADGAGKARGGDAETLPRGTETILFVEDNEVVLDLGRRMLEKFGYRVLTANGPEAAFKLAETWRNEIRLLITDVIMPEMNGKEMAERLKQMLPELKSLFVSGYSADIIGKHGVLDEGELFLQKPFSQGDIACKVRQALDS